MTVLPRPVGGFATNALSALKTYHLLPREFTTVLSFCFTIFFTLIGFINGNQYLIIHRKSFNKKKL